MNIFYLDENPALAAKYHCDKHVIKMILETAQLLSTAHRVLDGTMEVQKTELGRNVKRWIHPNKYMNDTLYTATHMNHPCSVWVRASYDNYRWATILFDELHSEYMRRWNKTIPHKSYSTLRDMINSVPRNISLEPFTTPPQAMPEEYKSIITTEAYRNYYINDKAHMLKYTNTDLPPFLLKD